MSDLELRRKRGIWKSDDPPEEGDLPADAARALLALKLPPADVEKVNELSARARKGTDGSGNVNTWTITSMLRP